MKVAVPAAWLPLATLALQPGAGIHDGSWKLNGIVSEVDMAVLALRSTNADDVGVEQRLLELRSRDARRTDMPQALMEGFVQLFEYRRDRDLDDPEPCDALAALHADHENWDDVASACEEAHRRSRNSHLFRRALWLRARRATWDWRTDDATEARTLCESDAVSAFHALSLPGLTMESRFERGRRALRSAIARVDKQAGAPLSSRPGGASRDASLPLVAVLTPDANGAHPLSQLLPSALCAVATYRIALVTMCAPDGSTERARFEASADVLVEAHSSSAAAIAAVIAELKPVALVDMCGFAGSSEVLDVVSRRPAPLIVQGGLGTPALMGAELYDYALCDNLVVPTAKLGAERPLRVPYTYFAADPAAYCLSKQRPRPSRSSYGLKPGALVLCCMNRAHKVEPELFDVWIAAVRDLAEIEGLDPQLWLFAPSESARDRALKRAASTLGSIEEAARRLVFAPHTSRSNHIERLACADIALDTRTYGSHTLACDYAFAGVPLVTSLADETWPSRVAASVGRAAVTAESRSLWREACEAPDWGQGYRRSVVALGAGAHTRRRLRNALAAGRAAPAPLWDPARWARGFQSVVDAARRGDNLLPHGSLAIVLSSDPSRVAHFETNVAPLLPEIDRFDAVEGADRHAVENALQELGGLAISPVFRRATTGQIACAASHALAWSRIMRDPFLADDDYALVLEDDAAFPRGGDEFRAAVADVVKDLRHHPADICYLYVYPDHWPDTPKTADRPVCTIPGFRTWCLVAYLVSKRGAKRLVALIRDLGDIYAPIDCIVADFAERGLIITRAADSVGFVDNSGQLDRRPPQPGKLRSNLWLSPRWWSDNEPQ